MLRPSPLEQAHNSHWRGRGQFLLIGRGGYRERVGVRPQLRIRLGLGEIRT
jgi:hypothetical protein